MLTRYWLQDGKLCSEGVEPAPILVYVDPSEQERRHLIDDLKVDEHTLSSALDPDELSRVEFEPEHAALIYKRPTSFLEEGKAVFRVGSCGLFLWRNRLIIVQAKVAPIFDGKQFARIPSISALVIRMLSRAVAHYLEHLRVITAITDDLEHKISSSMENSYLLRLFALERSLVYYVSALSSNAGLIERLRNSAAKLGFTPDEIEALDDLGIENAQCFKQAEMYSNILAGLMDARASIVSNNLNLVMKTLTFITIAIMVPTLVVSIFSMNVPIPGQHHGASFWGIMALAVVSILSAVVFFKRRKWL
jgi:magnesium transporter